MVIGAVVAAHAALASLVIPTARPPAESEGEGAIEVTLAPSGDTAPALEAPPSSANDQATRAPAEAAPTPVAEAPPPAPDPTEVAATPAPTPAAMPNPIFPPPETAPPPVAEDLPPAAVPTPTEVAETPEPTPTAIPGRIPPPREKPEASLPTPVVAMKDVSDPSPSFDTHARFVGQAPDAAPPKPSPSPGIHLVQADSVPRPPPPRPSPTPNTKPRPKKPATTPLLKADRTAAALATPTDGAEGTGSVSQAARASYGAILSAAIARQKVYPAAALAAHITGSVSVAFSVDALGRIANYQITRTSGQAKLDEEVRSMMAAVQAPPPPGGSFHGGITINFNLK